MSTPQRSTSRSSAAASSASPPAGGCTSAGTGVAVIDPAPAAAATHAAAGMLAPVSEVTYGETALLRFAMESLARYPAFVAELEPPAGQIVGLRREGTLIVATDAGDREMLVDLHAFQTSLGLVAHRC